MSDISNDTLLDIIGHDECSLTEAKDAARAALEARRERDEAREQRDSATAACNAVADAAQAVWEPRATAEDRDFYARYATQPSAAWIVGRLGSMLDEARAEAERLRTLFEDTERVRKSNLRACLEAQAEVERLRAVLRWAVERLGGTDDPDEWIETELLAAAEGRWDDVPDEAQGERDE